ncbi:MAG TPA: hypothetical protein PKX31_00140 [Chitinophagaceae bacterium]|nr:hypothetical protein [Chitinophagaceae bacterium]
MGLELEEELEKWEDEDRDIIKSDIKFADLIKPLKFPLVLTGFIMNDFDRMGSVKGCFFEMVSLEDFNEQRYVLQR